MPEAMMIKLLSSIIPAVLATATSAANLGINKKLQQENRDYNSPANQMQMMTAAGINPNAAASGISKSPYQSTPIEANLDSGADYLSAGLSEMSDQVFNTPETNSRTHLNESQTMLNALNAYFLPQIVDKQLQQFQDQHKQATVGYKILKEQARWASSVAAANYDLLLADLDLKWQEFNESEAREEKVRQETKTEEQQTRLVHAQVDTEKAREQQVIAETEESNARKAESVARKSNIESDTKGKDINNRISRFRAYVMKNGGYDPATANVAGIIKQIEVTKGVDAANQALDDFCTIQSETTRVTSQANADAQWYGMPSMSNFIPWSLDKMVDGGLNVIGVKSKRSRNMPHRRTLRGR